jgi:hypothetical protein
MYVIIIFCEAVWVLAREAMAPCGFEGEDTLDRSESNLNLLTAPRMRRRCRCWLPCLPPNAPSSAQFSRVTATRQAQPSSRR